MSRSRCAVSSALLTTSILAMVPGLLALPASAQPPAPQPMDSPSVTVLTGLTVPEFEREMQQFVQALGISCGGCHVGRGNFASDENPRKARARQMIEMTKEINARYFPDHVRTSEEDSVLGRVTCFTCHQGELQPKRALF